MIYRPILLLLVFCAMCSTTSSQTKLKLASITVEGTINVEDAISHANIETQRSDFKQLDNFPFKGIAHPNFKNFRNVSIADLDMDGKVEIVVCLNETLFVLNSDASVQWSYELEGTSNFPPAIADLDNDGDLEIALQTYGVPSVGNVYLFDHQGNLQEGWPLNVDNHFFLNGITFANIEGNGNLEIIASERINSNSGRVHALTETGESINGDWPITINGTPAFTPSVGDIDNDGSTELITSTTTALYAIHSNGNIVDGFPVQEDGAKFSYQSPLLVDLDGDEKLEIVGSRHNDLPGTYVINSEGNYYGEWPFYDDIWTFAPPAVADIDFDGDYEVFFGRPFFSETEEGAIILGYDHEGNLLDGFPIMGSSGSEGVITIADVDNDGDMELITSSNIMIEGTGFIHAYHIETQEEVENFPIEVEGFTYLNGAFLSDVDNDGLLDLTSLSYQSKFNTSNPDSALVNVFNLEIPFDESTILFNGYKGSLDHTGLISKTVSGVYEKPHEAKINISPNPAQNLIHLNSDLVLTGFNYSVIDIDGRSMTSGILKSRNINIEALDHGVYILFVYSGSKPYTSKFIKILD